jgi:hypothetical protein
VDVPVVGGERVTNVYINADQMLDQQGYPFLVRPDFTSMQATLAVDVLTGGREGSGWRYWTY